MGEVEVTIRLTNASNEILARRKKLAQSKVRTLEVAGLVKTGVVSLVLPSNIAEQPGLQRFSVEQAD